MRTVDKVAWAFRTSKTTFPKVRPIHVRPESRTRGPVGVARGEVAGKAAVIAAMGGRLPQAVSMDELVA